MGDLKPGEQTAFVEKFVQVTCASGLRGWQGKLRDVYDGGFEEFAAYAEIYGLHRRIGYATAEEAWEANPTVQGSTDPLDYRAVG